MTTPSKKSVALCKKNQPYCYPAGTGGGGLLVKSPEKSMASNGYGLQMVSVDWDLGGLQCNSNPGMQVFQIQNEDVRSFKISCQVPFVILLFLFPITELKTP